MAGMTECCPTCGRPMAARFQTSFREKLIRLADGTRTAAELAKLCGTTRGSVHVALTSLRQQGVKVKVKARVYEEKVLTREEFEYVAGLRQQGVSWRAIGELQKYSQSHIRKHYVRAREVYGEPRAILPGIVKKKETQPTTMSVCAN